jgi:hypothetical protein
MGRIEGDDADGSALHVARRTYKTGKYAKT